MPLNSHDVFACDSIQLGPLEINLKDGVVFYQDLPVYYKPY